MAHQAQSKRTVAEIESEIAELEKSRERLVGELFQMAQRVEWSHKVTVERIGRNPEIRRIDAALEALQAQQVALRSSRSKSN